MTTSTEQLAETTLHYVVTRFGLLPRVPDICEMLGYANARTAKAAIRTGNFPIPAGLSAGSYVVAARDLAAFLDNPSVKFSSSASPSSSDATPRRRRGRPTTAERLAAVAVAQQQGV